MNSTHQHPTESELHDKVLNAIRGALREEKEPAFRRILKTIGATAAALVCAGLPFFMSFNSQRTWVLNLALGFWAMYFLVGFSLLFKPQPRLMVSGVWSPFVIARFFLVSTLATIAQIIICPSFVFLDSPLGWNPMSALTEILMSVGGMNLCMGFCGFIFSVVAAGFGIGSVRKVAMASDFKSTVVVFSILLVTQIPVILVQVFSDELRPFSPFWLLGMFSGFLAVLGLKWRWNKARA